MRNLKRVLSLALATVMLMGMMVMGASAADKKPLTDLEKVTNKDAVNLMVDLEVITGKPDGSYAPAETVDRATMSTLIYKIMTGETNADSYKGTGVLADVPGNWAEGFINYCNSLKIVTGDGTNFYPGNKVTVAQAAKMLLTAVGYDAELSKYQGDAMWTVNVMRDAKKAGILAGVGQNSNDELTRDNAAQMVFNTLFADIVKPVIDRDQGVAYLTRYDKVGSTLASETYSLIEVSANVDTVADGKATFTTVTPDNANIVKTAINKAGITASPDMKGKNATLYIKGNVSYQADGTTIKSISVDKVYSSTVAAGASNVLATITNGTTLAKLTTPSGEVGHDKNKFVAELSDSATYFINGESKTSGQLTAVDGKKGVIVELIDTTGTGEIDMVKFINKQAKKVTGDVATRTYKDTLQVQVPGVVGTYTDFDKVVGYDDLAEGDYVLTYKDGDVHYLELAETVTGKITGKKSTNEIRVNGTYYGWSGLTGSDTIADVTNNAGVLDTKNEYNLILDNNGTITKVVAVTTESTSKTAIVLDKAWVSGGGIGAAEYLEVQLLLADGTTEIVTVAKVDGTTPTSITSTHPTVGNFYEYTFDKDDKYTLTKVADGVDGDVKEIAKGTKITNGSSAIVSGVVANSKTVYLVQKGNADDGYTYTAYTGFNAVPTMTIDVAGKAVVDGKIATYVYISADKFQGDTETLNYVYIINPDNYVTDVDADGDVVYVYDAIIEGEKSTLTVDKALDKDETPAGLYNVALTDGVASEAELKKAENKITLEELVSTDTIADGVVLIASIGTDVYTYDADTAVTVIMLDGNDTDVVNATTGDGFKFTAEEGYSYQVVIHTAKADGELLDNIIIFQTLVD